MTDTTTPNPPGHLSKRAAGHWRAIVKTWALGDHELELLRRLCEAIDRADAAVKILAAEGIVTTSRLGEVKAHPCVAIDRDARKSIESLTAALRLQSIDPVRPRDGRRRG